MASNDTRSGFSGRERPNPGYRGRDDGGSREPQANLDTSNIRFGAQISPILYSDVAERAAQQVAPQIPGRDTNKGTQLRRFYDELIMLQGKVGSSQERYDQQAPFVQMLKAKVAYAMGRKKVDANFDCLLRHVIDQIKDPATFGQAKLFMEAFMAFYKVHGPKD
jgi:CRISPR-associated protein Csm2